MTNLPLLRVIGLIFGAPFFVVGVLGIRHGLETDHWPATPGKIIVSERTGMGDHTSATIIAEFRQGPYFYHCGTVISGRNNASEDVRRFPLGAQVDIHHDPTNPARCVLLAGVSGGSIAFLITGLALFGAAGWAHRRLVKANPTG